MKQRRNSRQMTLDALFVIPKTPVQIPGSLNYAVELRHVLSQALKESPKSRYEIAAKMSEQLGIEITKNQLDAWTAESRDQWRFPLEYAAAFEAACGCYRLTELLAAKRGCKVLIGEEALLAELGRLERMEADLKEQKKLIKDHFKGNGRA